MVSHVLREASPLADFSRRSFAAVVFDGAEETGGLSVDVTGEVRVGHSGNRVAPCKGAPPPRNTRVASVYQSECVDTPKLPVEA